MLRRAGLRGQHLSVLAAGALLMATIGVLGAVRGGILQPGMVIHRADAMVIPREDEQGESIEKAAVGGGYEEGPPADSSEEGDGGKDATVVVHVDGAVGLPGVYEVTSSCPRVVDAVEQAGGLAPDADTLGVNLAAPLVDGQKVLIPHEGEDISEGMSATAAVVSVDAGSKVNINTATEEELKTLPGVGEVTARAIIDERERGGPFATPEDIMRVSGIGEKKYERLAGDICV